MPSCPTCRDPLGRDRRRPHALRRDLQRRRPGASDGARGREGGQGPLPSRRRRLCVRSRLEPCELAVHDGARAARCPASRGGHRSPRRGRGRGPAERAGRHGRKGRLRRPGFACLDRGRGVRGDDGRTSSFCGSYSRATARSPTASSRSREEHLADVYAVEVECVPDVPATVPMVADPFEQWRERIGRKAAAFVALDDGCVVGYATLEHLHGTPHRLEHGLTAVLRQPSGPRDRDEAEERADRVGRRAGLPRADHLHRHGERRHAAGERQARLRRDARPDRGRARVSSRSPRRSARGTSSRRQRSGLCSTSGYAVRVEHARLEPRPQRAVDELEDHDRADGRLAGSQSERRRRSTRPGSPRSTGCVLAGSRPRYPDARAAGTLRLDAELVVDDRHRRARLLRAVERPSQQRRRASRSRRS